MKKTMSGMFAVLFTVVLTAQNFPWVKSFGSDGTDVARSIIVDASGNVYTTGRFQGTVDLHPGAGTATHTSPGMSDVFVQKLDASGNLLWAKSSQGIVMSSATANSIALDAAGNIYTSGVFNATVDFDPGPGIANLHSAGSGDIFVQKLDASGNFIWAKSFGSNLTDQEYSMTVDASGNVYTTGYFYGTVDFDPGPATANLISTGLSDTFVQKLDTSGNFIWAKSFGSTSYDYGYSIKVDDSGNIYTAGTFLGTVDFDPGAGIFDLSSAGSYDIFVQKLDASGNFIWAKSFGGSLSDEPRSISLDASGNLHTTGYFEGTVDFDPGAGTAIFSSAGATDIFVQKLDASSNFVWTNSFGGSSPDYGNSVTVDASGNVYTAGVFSGTADFDPGAGTVNFTAAGNPDIFVQKLDAFGNFIWAKAFAGIGSDAVTGIIVDAPRNVYTAGYFTGTIDLDPGVGTAIFSSAGSTDIFVKKMNQDRLGTIDIGKNIGFRTYPNPSRGLVYLLFEKAVKDVEIMLIDLSGKVIFAKHKNVAVNEKINIDGPAGTYFLKIKTPEGESAVKLIKE